MTSTALLDTNALLRFLTNDIPKQAQLVEKRLLEAKQGKRILVLLPITIVEVLYQLDQWYHWPRDKASEYTVKILASEWIVINERAILLESVQEYARRNIDIVDLLLWSTAKQQKWSVLSFDKDYDKLEPNVRLEP